MFLCACSTGPAGYLKRSANNKIFDRSGAKGGKRAPLYNKKYISQAKKNVVTGEYEDDLDDIDDIDIEVENTSRDNMEMYKSMLKNEALLSSQNSKDTKSKKNNGYPSLVKGKQLISGVDDNIELKKELSQIKAMLQETQKEVANSRCPGNPLVPDSQAPSTIDSKNKQLNNVKKTESALPLKKEKQALKIIAPKKTIILEPVESL